MKSMLISAIGLALVVVLSQGPLAEGVKFVSKLPEQPEAPPTLFAGPIYPAAELQQQQQQQFQQQQELKADLGTKGGQIKESEEISRQRPQQPYYPQQQQPYYPQQQQPYYPQQQQPYYPQQPYGNRPTTWVVIRPVTGYPTRLQEPYYSSYLFRPQDVPEQWIQPPVRQPLTEGFQQTVAGTKGGEIVKQEQVPEEGAVAMEVPPKGVDKFAKLKSSFDKLKAKLTLGSSYTVQSEEIMPPPPPAPPALIQREPLPQPLEQQQVKQGQEEDIRLTQQEQQNIKEAERQEQEQVQSLEQEKLSSIKQQLGAGEELPPSRKLPIQPQEPAAQDSFDRRQQQSRPINENQQYADLPNAPLVQHQDLQRITKQQQQQQKQQ